MKSYAKLEMVGPMARKLLKSLPNIGPGPYVDALESKRVSRSLGAEVFSIRMTGVSYPEVFVGVTADEKDPSRYSVTNVVLVKEGLITVEQYNQAILDFYDQVIRPHEGPNLIVSPPRGHRDLSEFLPEEGINLLRSFSELANKTTGASHPLDQRRWEMFIIFCHRNNVELNEALLTSALVDEFGWPPDVARDLASSYVSGRELLQHYDMS